MDSHCPELFQQFSVVHIVEEPLDVYIYDIVEIASLHILMNLSDCVLLVPVRAESIAMVVEFSLTYRLHDLQYALLYQPVHNCRYSKRAFLCWVISFRNLYPPDTLRNVPV